jgi:SH3-like domain-containing protein
LERFTFKSLVWLLAAWISAGCHCLAQESGTIVRVEAAARVIVRSAPEVRPETVVTVVDRGAEFPFVDEEGDWFEVGLPDGGSGWVNRSLATRFDWMSVRGNALTLADEPSDGAREVETVGAGERILILRREAEWARVRGPAGAEGWVREELLASSPGETGEESADVGSGVDGDSAEDDLHPGPALLEAGRRDEALDAFERAAAADPDSSDPHLPSAKVPAWEDLLGPLPPHLPAIAAGTLLLAVAFGLWIYRRRRLRKIESALRFTTSVDERLKSASAARLGETLRRSEDRVKRIDRGLQERFRRLKAVMEENPPPAGEAAEGPLGKVDQLRDVVLRQQKQIEAMTRLLEAQTEKVSALEDENRLLRGLVKES